MYINLHRDYVYKSGSDLVLLIPVAILIILVINFISNLCFFGYATIKCFCARIDQSEKIDAIDDKKDY